MIEDVLETAGLEGQHVQALAVPGQMLASFAVGVQRLDDLDVAVAHRKERHADPASRDLPDLLQGQAHPVAEHFDRAVQVVDDDDDVIDVDIHLGASLAFMSPGEGTRRRPP